MLCALPRQPRRVSFPHTLAVRCEYICSSVLMCRLGVFSSAAEWEPYDGDLPPFNFMGGGYLSGQMGGYSVTGAGQAPSSGRLTLPRNNMNFRKYSQKADFQDETA